MKIKTYKEWIKSEHMLDDYLVVGDIVDNELILWACEVLPPKTDTKTCVQMCEADDFKGGMPRYTTFRKISNKWVYTGSEPKINK
mgnify:CR=1 FL=1|tara:strand:+ start:1391 stop:1645 length:255 start_codon:yes stop_codon:yes gene_type:complete